MLLGCGARMEPNRFRKQFNDIEDACVLPQAIVDTVRDQFWRSTKTCA
jgi:hypothetical protein